jgi:NADH-quinone oxidoreductase subunit J
VTVSGFIFYVLAAVTVIATAVAVTRRQAIHTVLYLIVAFLGTAGLFYLLGAPLLAAFMIIIYAGAIMVLVLFVIMLFQRSPRELSMISDRVPAALLGLMFLALAVGVVFKDPGAPAVLETARVAPAEFGRLLFERYWLPIEIVSLLFLVVIVILIQLGRRKIAIGEDEEDT